MSFPTPKLLFAENKTEAPGVQFIIDTEFNMICQVIKGSTTQATVMQVPGYSIFIVNRMTRMAEKQVLHMREILLCMALFYLEERIKPNLKYYERYKL